MNHRHWTVKVNNEQTTAIPIACLLDRRDAVSCTNTIAHQHPWGNESRESRLYWYTIGDVAHICIPACIWVDQS